VCRRDRERKGEREREREEEGLYRDTNIEYKYINLYFSVCIRI